MSLKSFIISEKLHAEYAARYLTYLKSYHSQVLFELKKELEKSWKNECKLLAKNYKLQVDTNSVYDITPKLEVDENPYKINSGRHQNIVTVSPSVKIPLAYSSEERKLIITSLFGVAKKVFETITSDWKEIFKVEYRSNPWVKIIQDQSEIRLQLILSNDNQEEYRTIYAIRIDYGRSGSKIRDCDRVYLISLESNNHIA